MRSLLAVLVVGAAGYLGWLGYEAHDRSSYGISESSPLGTFEAMDTYLAGPMGLQKTEAGGAMTDLTPLTGAAKFYQYLDTNNGIGNGNDRIFLVQDAGGKLVGIVGFTRPSMLPVAVFSMAHRHRVFRDKPHAKDGEATVTLGGASGKASIGRFAARFFFYIG